ncbi:cyclic nucleotide-binding domain-containing protein [bacterium]|nr:cyclic nucleotide-binding domain-containing protein [bacterium]
MLKSDKLTEYDVHYMKESSLFSGLNDSMIKSLEASISIFEFNRTEEIFSEKSNSTEIYLILRGQVELIRKQKNKKNFLITVLSAKDFFGEMAFLTGASRNDSAIARTDCRVISLNPKIFSNSTFSDHCMSSSCLKFILLTNIAKKLALNLESLNNEHSRLISAQSNFFNDHHSNDMHKLSYGISNIRNKYMR